VAVAWAREEVGSADFGDERLDARATTLLTSLGSRPNLSIPAACAGRAETQAAYRFFDNPKVTFEKVLAPHALRTRERMAARDDVVLLVQDTTEIELTRPGGEVGGVGELGGSRRGFLLHVMHAFTADGTPLGTAWSQVVNRVDGVRHDPPARKRERNKARPIEDKESMRWLAGLRAARELAGRTPRARCVCVADSEADVYELFAEPRAEPGATARAVDLLIRAGQDRALEPCGPAPAGGPLRARVMARPVLYEVELLVRGREAKTGVEDRARRQGRQTRRAEVQVRAAAAVTLRPPWRQDRTLPPVAVNVVMVGEANPPAGEPAVEWVLVTTLPVDTPEQVRTVVGYYCARWNVEVLFRTLKSGCRVERRRFEHADRVLPCLGLYLIVAWRTLFVCRMGRECPDADCELLFEPSEWKAVWVAVHGGKPPRERPRLAEVVHLVARLGGYVRRPDSPPGAQTMWIGLQRMYDLAWAWESFGPGTKHGAR
jgi:hypothetical protein